MTAVASEPQRSSAPPLELDQLLGRGTRAITVAASRDPNAKVTMLLLRPGSTTPTLAVKIPTTLTAALSVDTEARVLGQLSERLTPALLATVPRVIARVSCEHGRALVTTALPGVPLTTRYHRWRHVSHPRSVQRDFAVAARWLERLQTASATEPASVEFTARLIPRVRDRFEGMVGLDAVLAHLSAIDHRFRGESTPRTVVHGDYWAGNLLADGDHPVGVVDWEAASMHGEPMRDIARFATAYALYLDRHTRPGLTVRGHPGLRAGTWGAGILFAVDGDGWFPRLVRAFTAYNLERLGVSGDRWRDALVCGVADAATTADDPQFARHHFVALVALARSGSEAARW